VRARRALGLCALTVVLSTGLAACSGGSRYTVTATFDDVGDLVKGHSVQVADVRVGRVESIKLLDDFQAEVKISIREGVKIPARSTAFLRTTSLLGEKFLELRPDEGVGPQQGPFLSDGSIIERSAQAPEIEFVADEAIRILAAVAADDIGSLIDTGAAAFEGRSGDLRQLITDLSAVSRTLAERSGDITTIIDRLDSAIGSFARGRDELTALLTNLSDTTRILAENRDRAVNALRQLTRLAAVQNEVLTRYHDNLDRQIKQVAAIIDVAVTQTGEVATLIDWLSRFTDVLPRATPNDFVQVFGWVAPTNTPQGEP
jgi:phospholipid/cholesterol/gamma-HCH transport system substrate-binding protein